MRQFAELDTFINVYQKDSTRRGLWAADVFKNQNPIVLELACGKGEYTVNLAKRFPDKNFIGVDIKGNRLWTGAKMGLEQEIANVAFLRGQIEHLQDYFAAGEVSEIWITFPDPHPRLGHEKKRLTSPRFLELYRPLLSSGAIVHLKTDSDFLYGYTMEILQAHQFPILASTDHLYSSSLLDDVLSIKTAYERKYLDIGKSINYVKFSY